MLGRALIAPPFCGEQLGDLVLGERESFTRPAQGHGKRSDDNCKQGQHNCGRRSIQSVVQQPRESLAPMRRGGESPAQEQTS